MTGPTMITEHARQPLTPGLGAAAGACEGPAGEHRAFRVTASVAEVAQIDLGAAGPPWGDEIVFSGPLLQDGHQVGHQGAARTTVSLQRHEAQCAATYSFRGGQITAQTLFVLGSPAPHEVAITGGTGRYQGAEGEIHLRPATPANPDGVLTFHLEN